MRFLIFLSVIALIVSLTPAQACPKTSINVMANKSRILSVIFGVSSEQTDRNDDHQKANKVPSRNTTSIEDGSCEIDQTFIALTVTFTFILVSIVIFLIFLCIYCKSNDQLIQREIDARTTAESRLRDTEERLLAETGENEETKEKLNEALELLSKLIPKMEKLDAQGAQQTELKRECREIAENLKTTLGEPLPVVIFGAEWRQKGFLVPLFAVFMSTAVVAVVQSNNIPARASFWSVTLYSMASIGFTSMSGAICDMMEPFLKISRTPSKVAVFGVFVLLSLFIAKKEFAYARESLPPFDQSSEEDMEHIKNMTIFFFGLINCLVVSIRLDKAKYAKTFVAMFLFFWIGTVSAYRTFLGSYSIAETLISIIMFFAASASLGSLFVKYH
ncbi:hypothetical protein GCK72_010733 [Caenorhabditis remanei]|uniref:Uncharacterized protein n=1 Tax=Caenorhabditis remanei TaxID=31234 RepID=A0A6A5H6E7_CAERE|nr:hypothetical protein GCK72_010733 [Caenorhabditis remanei]KAF1762471.1 hypothetical protein GCK72_010733 [Caenorhabditis remanei]